jgi:hypothetical protein
LPPTGTNHLPISVMSPSMHVVPADQ